MAQVKFYKINNSSLSSLPIVEGQLIFVQDTGTLYIDKDNSNRIQIANYTDATTSASGLMSSSDKTKLNGISESADAVGYSQILESGTKIGTITINGSDTDIYAPQPGAVSTELVNPRSTYYLTGVTETTASQSSQVYNTRLSDSFTGVKYETSTTTQGGTLSVDGREVTLGLYYTIA